MQEDINMLIQNHLGLVYNQLHRYKLSEDPEAQSIAYEALYNAVLNYDASKGTKLSTLATVYIYNALGSYVRALKSKRQIQTISYNNLIEEDGSNEKHEYLERLSTDEDIEADYINREIGKYAMSMFDTLYAKLTNEKHQVILRKWKESEFTAQTKDIAKEVGVSQSYVSQVINNFKFNLRKKLEDMYYD